jgi:hypothetical protein
MFSQETISGKEVLTFDGVPLEGRIRTTEELVEDFKASAGKFEEFHSGLSLRERTLFQGWLQSLRTTKGN